MGTVHANSGIPSPPKPSSGINVPGPESSSKAPPSDGRLQPPEEHKPGLFEDLHKSTKEIFPVIWEGAKIILNKPLSSHFQVSHTLSMGQINSGYKFGTTFVGPNQLGPAESYPVLLGEIDPSGNLNAQIIHAFSKKTKFKAIYQIQNGRMNSQHSADYKGNNFSCTATLANIDVLKGTGVYVGHYLQRITNNVDLGAELVFQRDAVNTNAIYSIGGRYNGDRCVFSGNVTPSALGAHFCFSQKVTDKFQIASELEGSLAQGECTATVGYNCELDNYNFKGQVDTNYTIGATMEKRLAPLPFSFVVSALANHQKNVFRFGIGLNLGQ